MRLIASILGFAHLSSCYDNSFSQQFVQPVECGDVDLDRIFRGALDYASKAAEAIRRIQDETMELVDYQEDRGLAKHFKAAGFFWGATTDLIQGDSDGNSGFISLSLESTDNLNQILLRYQSLPRLLRNGGRANNFLFCKPFETPYPFSVATKHKDLNVVNPEKRLDPEWFYYPEGGRAPNGFPRIGQPKSSQSDVHPFSSRNVVAFCKTHPTGDSKLDWIAFGPQFFNDYVTDVKPEDVDPGAVDLNQYMSQVTVLLHELMHLVYDDVLDVKIRIKGSGRMCYGFHRTYQLANPPKGLKASVQNPRTGSIIDIPVGFQGAMRNADSYAYFAAAAFLPEREWNHVSPRA